MLNRGANIGPATLSFCIPRQVLLSRVNFQSHKVNDKVARVQVVKEYLGGGGIAASWDYTEVSYHHAPAALFSGKNPGAHRIGGFVGPSAVLDVLRKTKITCWNSNPGPSSP